MTIPPRSLRLRTLGGVSIGEGNSPSHRSRRALALLSIVAAAGADGVERDRILALLWPESGADRANNSFRQILFAIRRDLGAGAFVSESGRLRLNPALFSVDLWDFEYAFHNGELDRAAAVYSGPFLDAFYIAGLGAFERWTDGERARLQRMAVTSLQRLAESASARGDQATAVEAWRAVNTVDPLSSASALGLLHALANTGDRAGALHFARTYEELLRTELDVAPDESVARYIASLRDWAGEPTIKRPVSPSAPSSRESQSAAVHPAAPTAPAAAVPPAPRPARHSWRDSAARLARHPIGIAAALVFAALIPAAARFWNTSATYSPNLVAILPLRGYNAADSLLGVEATSLLASDLDGAGSFRALHPPERADVAAARRHAADQGAGYYVFGDLVTHSDSTRVSASLIDARSGVTIGERVVVEGNPRDLVGLVDDVAARLIAARYDRPLDRLDRAAALSARSIEALKAFLRGSTALRERHFGAAADAFRDATLADTAFAIAYYRLAVASEWCSRTAAADGAIDLAVRYSNDLPDHDRLLISAYAAWHMGLRGAAEKTYRSIVDDYPDDAEAWHQLGIELFHATPLREQAVAQARDAFEHALTLDPSDVEATVYLVRIATLDGRPNDAARLSSQATRLLRDTASLDAFAFRALAFGDRFELRSHR